MTSFTQMFTFQDNNLQCYRPPFEKKSGNFEKIWKFGKTFGNLEKLGKFGNKLGKFEKFGKKLEVWENWKWIIGYRFNIGKILPWYTSKVCQLSIYKYWSK